MGLFTSLWNRQDFFLLLQSSYPYAPIQNVKLSQNYDSLNHFNLSKLTS